MIKNKRNYNIKKLLIKKCNSRLKLLLIRPSSYNIIGGHDDIHQALIRRFFEKLSKPTGRELRVSFKIILVINKVNSKTHSVSVIPFKVVQKGPCKISFYIHTLPSHNKPNK